MKTQPNWQRLRSGELDWSIFKLRERVLWSVRTFFRDCGFLEIESPLLTPFPTLDANIHSFRTAMQAEGRKPREFYLHTSPEYSMKKLISAGSGNIFFVGKVFRNRELTPLHNPEFTMVEWYRLDADYLTIQQDTEDLIRFIVAEAFPGNGPRRVGLEMDFSPHWNRITVRELFLNHTGIDLDSCPNAESLSACAKKLGTHTNPDDDWETLFFRIFLEKIEPFLGVRRPVFVMDYPVRMGLMAKRKAENPEWVERTELYIAGTELANGYTELVDPVEQRARLEAERKKKRNAGDGPCPVDEGLLQALELGLPPCAGIALGLDRLIMLLAGKKYIEEVLPFPVHQWMD